jgi:SynChlorMet cassette protein ScmC
MRRFRTGLEEFTAHLALADGSRWSIVAGDEFSSIIVSQLKAAMQLSPVSPSLTSARDEDRLIGNHRELRVLVEPERAVWNMQSDGNGNKITCVIGPEGHGDMFALHLIEVSHVFVIHAVGYGGLLLHGALAEQNGSGVILAGSGGAGKTTASHRLVSPWRSLSDDVTLVVRDDDGAYWAHPWPTWSSFLAGGAGGTWNVQYAVPLKAVFFLEQADEEYFQSVDIPQAVCLLNRSAEQSTWSLPKCLDRDELKKTRLKRFDNICAMAQTIPSFILRLGLKGPFWQEIERALSG